MSEARLNIKQVLLTAGITCVFTVIAGYTTYLITTEEANLTYAVTSGPSLSLQGAHKRIFSVEVTNGGRKEVVDVSATMAFKGGVIEEASFAAQPGVQLIEDKKRSSYLLTAPMLNPREHFSVSLLASSPSPDFFPEIAVRGRGVNASVIDTAGKDSKPILYLIVGSIAAFLGLLTSVSPIARKVLGSVTVTYFARPFSSFATAVGPFDRNELVAYILGLCSLQDYSRQIRFSPSEISFRGAADYMALEGLGASEEGRRRFVTALKCMLLIDRINEDSVQVISSALKKLSGLSDDSVKTLREKAIDSDLEPVRLREVIADLVQAELG